MALTLFTWQDASSWCFGVSSPCLGYLAGNTNLLMCELALLMPVKRFDSLLALGFHRHPDNHCTLGKSLCVLLPWSSDTRSSLHELCCDDLLCLVVSKLQRLGSSLDHLNLLGQNDSWPRSSFLSPHKSLEWEKKRKMWNMPWMQRWHSKPSAEGRVLKCGVVIKHPEMHPSCLKIHASWAKQARDFKDDCGALSLSLTQAGRSLRYSPTHILFNLWGCSNSLKWT